MTESILIIVVTALVNGGVTWGVLSTKMAWLRRDIDRHDRRLVWLERRQAGEVERVPK